MREERKRVKSLYSRLSDDENREDVLKEMKKLQDELDAVSSEMSGARPLLPARDSKAAI